MGQAEKIEYSNSLFQCNERIEQYIYEMQELGEKYDRLNAARNVEKINKRLIVCGILALIDSLFKPIVFSFDVLTYEANGMAYVLSVIICAVIYVVISRLDYSGRQKMWIFAIGMIISSCLSAVFVGNVGSVFCFFACVSIVFFLLYLAGTLINLKEEKKYENYLLKGL